MRDGRRTPILGTILLAVLLAACGGDGGVADGAPSTVIDTLSDGRVHVVNRPAPEPDHLVEVARIGRFEGEGPDVFGQIKGLVVTDDGLVAVLESQAQEIRVFDLDGRHVATYGGLGEGPGEFSEANGLMLSPAGELWVPDHGNSRMSFIDPRNGFRDSEPMLVMRYGFTWHGTMMDDGQVVRPSVTPGPPRRAVFRFNGPAMEPLDSVFIPEGPPTDPEDPPTSMYWEAPGGLPRGYMGLPFAESGAMLIHPSGVVWSAPVGADGYRLVKSTLDLDTTTVVEVARDPTPVDPEVRDSTIRRMQEAIRERNGDIGSQSWDKVPDRYPFVERIFPGEDGEIWVETGTAGGARFDVFGPDGVLRGTVDTDLAFVGYVDPVVRDGEVWGVVLDDLDVPWVVRARVASANP